MQFPMRSPFSAKYEQLLLQFRKHQIPFLFHECDLPNETH